jgi:hypothetical protein
MCGIGGAGTDALEAGPGYDVARGGPGDDSVYGSEGNDRIYGDAGNASIRGGSGEDREFGNAGEDNFKTADANVDIVRGGLGTDTILSEDKTDEIKGVEIYDYLQRPSGPFGLNRAQVPWTHALGRRAAPNTVSSPCQAGLQARNRGRLTVS